MREGLSTPRDTAIPRLPLDPTITLFPPLCFWILAPTLPLWITPVSGDCFQAYILHEALLGHWLLLPVSSPP